MSFSLRSYSRPLLQRVGQRSLSSARPPLTAASGSSRPPPPDGNSTSQSHLEHPEQQPFVNTRIRAGEWDPETRTNPLYRPQFRSTARIIHQDDFARQPTVGFSGEYESFQDAMVTLSWLDESDQKQIYTLYLDILQHSHQKHQRTSHEYIMRVIAQKFNITPERVAAVVQLQHNEEQMKRDPNVKLLTEAAAYMENGIKETIVNAYKTFKLKKPEEPFVEDPVGVSGLKERKTYQVVEDLLDVDKIMQDTVLREEKQARLAIDGHHYIEDVDDDTIPIPTGKDCKKLLKAHEKFATSGMAVVNVPQEEAQPGGGAQTRRERWKFVAQVVNTRELKKEHRSHRSYINNSPQDTLVEHNGTLRAANMADVKQVAWKPIRHVSEHIYGDAKRGWLDRQLRGIEEAWGKAPENTVHVNPIPPRAEKLESNTPDEPPRMDGDEEAKDTGSGSDTEGSSSSEEETSDREEKETTTEEHQDEKDSSK